VLSISQLDKLPEADKFVIFRSKSPEQMSEGLKKQIELTAQQIADAFELKNSPMLIQMISDGERAYVLEFSARTGGGEKFIMIEKVSGFDVIGAVVDLTLGKTPQVKEERPEAQLFATEFIYCIPGVFDHLENFEELKSNGVICEYYCFKSKGSEFDGIAKTSLSEYLINILERVYKYHIAFKTLLYDEEDKGMFAASNGGYIYINKLYSTIGINGLNEAARFLGLEVSNNKEYLSFLQLILGTIKEQNKKHSIKDKKRPFLFNSEVVPAEGLGGKNYRWDKEDGLEPMPM
jgi:hypothetical protein